MSTYSNRLQPALQNLLQRVIQFFHPRSSCPMHISEDVCGGQKSLIKPVTRQNISSCSVRSPEIVVHDDAYISGRSDNNIKRVMHDDPDNVTHRQLLSIDQVWRRSTALTWSRWGCRRLADNIWLLAHDNNNNATPQHVLGYARLTLEHNLHPSWL